VGKLISILSAVVLWKKMVFAGQDAWRKHPLIYQCYKKPFPGLGTAVTIFGSYLLLDWVLTSMKTAPYELHHSKVQYSYKEAGDYGDTMPEVKVKNVKHH
jgi:hypothetical protein